MSSGYSAHPELASEQLKNAENANKTKNKTATTTTATTTKMSQRHSPQHRRHNKTTEAKMSTTKISNNQGETTTTSRGFFSFSPFKTKTKNAELATTNSLQQQQQKQINMPPTPTPTRATTPQKTLPDRTRQQNNFPNVDNDENNDGGEKHANDNNTKDCVDCAPSPNISHDQLQQRLSRNRQNSFYHQNRNSEDGGNYLNNDNDTIIVTSSSSSSMKTSQLPAFSDGCLSGFSSTISSPSPSTVSSPLSTPTRLTTQLQHSHQNCCRKISLTPGANSTHHNHHQHHHLHNHHHHHLGAASTAASSSSAAAAAGATSSGCKKLQKFDPRLGPSPYRQLLPIILCILSFATVFTILIIYMDTTEIRHQQFRLNMTRDYDLLGVSQDDPALVAFLREIHMRKNRLHVLNKNRGVVDDPTASSIVSATATTGIFNLSAHHDGLVPEMAHFVADLLGNKLNGAVIQSLSGNLGQLITAQWLAETLNWAGIIIEPEPRRYFSLLNQNSQRPHMQVVHACVSPNPYPKEVTIHTEESDVRINSILDEETTWFNSRVKCFPLYTIMLACNRVEYDLLSLGVHGHELEILKTLPFDKIKIEVISIHLQDNFDKLPHGYLQTIKKFLLEKGYKLQKEFGNNYFYRRINTTNRTRKKDILLLKTP